MPARRTVPLVAMIAILGGAVLVARALAPLSGVSGDLRGTTFARDALPFVDEAMTRGLVPTAERVGIDGLAAALNALHPDYVPSALAGLTFEAQPLVGALVALLVCAAALAPLAWLALGAIGRPPRRAVGWACLGLLALALPVWIVAMQASGVRVLTAEQVPLRSVCWALYGACCLHLLADVLRKPWLAPAYIAFVVAALYTAVFHWWRPASLSPWLPETRPLAAEHDAIAAALGQGRSDGALLGWLGSFLESMPMAAFAGLVFVLVLLVPRLDARLERRHPLLPLIGMLGALSALLLLARGEGLALLTPREGLERQAVLFLLGAVLLESFCRREPLRHWLRGDDGSDGGVAGRGASRERLSERTRRLADEGRRLAAIRQHRADSGAGQSEASWLIEDYLAGR